MSFRDRNPISGKSSLPPGTRLNGIYEIDQFIASGGMGEIYAGHTVEIGDKVAIKVVLPEFAADELILKLFRKEAHILHLLHHDAIVRYHIFAVDEGIGRSYLAMEYVDGPSLAQRLRSGPLSMEEAITLKNRLSDGLQQAHQAGIVHRDLSPDNVILPANSVSRAKIIDFGIAKAATTGAERTLIGSTFAGRQTYASPEQLGMFAPAKVTNQSDIYSLALVLAAAIRGEPIDMSGSPVEAIEKRRKVPDLSDIPGRMRGLLTAMLQPDPADRLASMSEVRDWEITDPPPAAPPIELRPPATDDLSVDQRTSQRPRSVTGRSLSKHPSLAPGRRPSLPPRSDYRDDFAEPKSRFGLWIGIGTMLTIALGAAGGWYYVKTVAPPIPTLQEPVNPSHERLKPPTIANPKKSNELPQPAPPNPPPSQPVKPITTNQEAARFIRGFYGGACFFMWPLHLDVGNRAAKVEGFGTNVNAFGRFVAEFTNAANYEPDVVVHEVTRAQCSVIDSLRRISLARGHGINPRLTLASRQHLASGEVLKGDVLTPPDLKPELLLVDDAGKTRRLTSLLTNAGQRGLEFSFPIKASGEATASEAPQLIIVLASPAELQPLAGLGPSSSVDAATLFPKLADQAEAGGRITLAVDYFKMAAH